MSKKNILLPILCATSLALAGCAADGQRYRADTYSTAGVNRAQEVTTVEILAINPAKVAVDNSSAGSRARTTGAVLGAIAGALVGQAVDSNTHNTLVGAGTGAVLGGLAGDAASGSGSTSYVDGVQIIYKTSAGRMFQSTQVGRICEFKTGTAILVAPTPAETRIQPNNPYGCSK